MEYIENAFEKNRKIGGYPSPFATPEQKEKKRIWFSLFQKNVSRLERQR